MKLRRCDRCGADIKGYYYSLETVRKVPVDERARLVDKIIIEEKDLCENCVYGLEKFISNI